MNESGKEIIWRYTKNLKETNFSVMNQLPRELAERRRQLVQSTNPPRKKNQKVKWIGQKLLLEGKSKNVKRDHIKDIHSDVIQIGADTIVKRALPSTCHGSSFQGSVAKVTNTDDVISPPHAIYGDTRVVRATNNTYA